MSNRIYIDPESYGTLLEWTKEYHKSIYNECYYFKRCEIIFKKYDVTAHAEVKKNGKIRINVRLLKEQIAKCDIIPAPEEKKYDTYYELADFMDLEQGKALVELMIMTYFMINNFLFFGNMVENKELTAAGRNDGKDKVIVFRKYKEQFYAVPVNSHRSPEGVFSVRGHLRRYKSGKIVWIDSYFKGLGDENE